jgi:hypothetical protein
MQKANPTTNREDEQWEREIRDKTDVVVADALAAELKRNMTTERADKRNELAEV